MEEPGERGGEKKRHRRDCRRDAESRPQHACANDPPGVTQSGPDRSANGSHKHEPEKSDTPVEQNHGRRKRFGSRSRRRVSDADDVAADIAGQEIIEERGDEERRCQFPEPEDEPLCSEEHSPAPGARENHRQIKRKRAEQPDRGSFAGDGP